MGYFMQTICSYCSAHFVLKQSICTTVFLEESSAFTGTLVLSILEEFPVDWYPRGVKLHSGHAEGLHKKISIDFHINKENKGSFLYQKANAYSTR